MLDSLKQGKRFVGLFLAVAQLVLGTQVWGLDYYVDSRPLPYNPCCDEGDRWAIAGELLYFKPSIDQSAFAITSTNNRFGGNVYPFGKRHVNNATYEPGFRVETLYNLCNCDNTLDFRFTYFNAGHCNSTFGDFLFDTIGFPGDGAQYPEDTTYAGHSRRRDHYKYYAGDATMNFEVANNCCNKLIFLAGLHYAYIHHKLHFAGIGSFINNGVPTEINNRLSSNSRFWGIGPEIGFDYRYSLNPLHCFLDGFVLKANARASLLCSNTQADFQYKSGRTGPVGVDIHNQSVWRVNPAADARLGVSYTYCGNCYTLGIELGYEFLWYSKSINTITGYDVAYAGDTIDVYNSLSLQGPYFALNLGF